MLRRLFGQKTEMIELEIGEKEFEYLLLTTAKSSRSEHADHYDRFETALQTEGGRVNVSVNVEEGDLPAEYDESDVTALEERLSAIIDREAQLLNADRMM